MFYGNGTARLVRNGAGVMRSECFCLILGSPLLDKAAFWFGDLGEDFSVVSAHNHENFAPDHVIFTSNTSRPSLEMEIIFATHVAKLFLLVIFLRKDYCSHYLLCKWGPTTFTTRMRILPSGRPPEEARP